MAGPHIDHPANERPPSLGQKINEKLADSRYFAISLLFHGLLVVAASFILISKYLEEPEFVAEGGQGLVGSEEEFSQPAENPEDAVPTETVTPQTPDVSNPNIDGITTSGASTFKMAESQTQIKVPATRADLSKTTSNMVKGVGGAGVPGAMAGRFGTGKKAAMLKNKMKDPTEQAIVRGLEWLRLNQSPDGSWGAANKGAMTGLALLCFLGHGETSESQNYGLTVNKAVQWIIDNGTKSQGRLGMEASFSQHGVYEHGICTYALGEYFAMTRDERVLELFKQAIAHIVEGQGPDGGWMYSFDKSRGDLSVSGWQIQALKAAYLTKLGLPGVDQALDKAMSYIDSVKGGNGGYGYRGPEDRYSLTGVGILAKLFWKGSAGDVSKGMTWLIDETAKNKPVKYKGPHSDLYAWYYHTQACLMYGGLAWDSWNKWFQDEIVGAQSPDGSWPVPGAAGHGPQGAGDITGAVYRTTLCILMLETFYRYLPTGR